MPPSPPIAWEAILDGPLADQAWQAARQIADEIMGARGERTRADDLTLCDLPPRGGPS